MNGAHDMGGMMGFGPVVPEKDEPVFHAAWERRAFALTLAMGAPGGWNIDQSRVRRARACRRGYLAKSYYEIWIAGLEKLLAERGLVTPDEIGAGKALLRQPVARILTVETGRRRCARAGPPAGRRRRRSASRWAIASRPQPAPAGTRGCRATCAGTRGRSRTCTAPTSSPTLTPRAAARPAVAIHGALRGARAVGRRGGPHGLRVGGRLGELSGAGMTLHPEPRHVMACRPTAGRRCLPHHGRRRPSPWWSRCTRRACSPGPSGPRLWRLRSRRRRPPATATPARLTMPLACRPGGPARRQERGDPRGAGPLPRRVGRRRHRTPHGTAIELRAEDFRADPRPVRPTAPSSFGCRCAPGARCY